MDYINIWKEKAKHRKKDIMLDETRRAVYIVVYFTERQSELLLKRYLYICTYVLPTLISIQLKYINLIIYKWILLGLRPKYTYIHKMYFSTRFCKLFKIT